MANKKRVLTRFNTFKKRNADKNAFNRVYFLDQKQKKKKLKTHKNAFNRNLNHLIKTRLNAF